ncbi:amidohydrolase family protein [Pollutimonas bauzanensis]|uniref:Predicted metal-dependent hydrolase, TIM-barrel fold n=1 Tax=Pollutimonas bauzanensis TaxID=658167 RepID=A0A1M5UPW6_9BURK|nr:amidohydrolase family protein [Pollutimonas bauzanensis]SHH64926.1 Predicted metal-dependent hydrolase, TIM-barrel fold [Pollutimonas bauzanensis]
MNRPRAGLVLRNPRRVGPFIDAHQHFWQLGANPYPWLQDEPVADFRYGDYSALKRDYLPADLARDTRGHAPAATVHIEAEWDRAAPVAETRWLSELADRTGLPSVIVAHAALGRADAKEVLAAQAGYPRTRGIRCKPVSAPAPEQARRGLPGSMDDIGWRDGYARLAVHGFSFDLQAPWWNLDQAAALAADFPRIPLIINHTGLPVDRSPAGLAAWRRALESVARAGNAAIKISGLGQLGVRWSEAANVPVMRDAISIFGVERCMFASNFPVDSLVASYGEILAGYLAAISPWPPEQQRLLLHDNAKRIYRI